MNTTGVNQSPTQQAVVFLQMSMFSAIDRKQRRFNL